MVLYGLVMSNAAVNGAGGGFFPALEGFSPAQDLPVHYVAVMLVGFASYDRLRHVAGLL